MGVTYARSKDLVYETSIIWVRVDGGTCLQNFVSPKGNVKGLSHGSVPENDRFGVLYTDLETRFRAGVLATFL